MRGTSPTITNPTSLTNPTTSAPASPITAHLPEVPVTPEVNQRHPNRVVIAHQTEAEPTLPAYSQSQTNRYSTSVEPVSNQLCQLMARAYEEVYAEGGNKARARAYFMQVLELDPFNESALLWLGYLTNEVEQRIQLFQQVVTLYPHNQVAQAYLKEALGRREVIEDLVAHTTAREDFWSRAQRQQARRQMYIPHLGEYLVRRHLITQAQLDEVLEYHQELILIGSKKKLGEILLERGYLAAEQLDHVLRLQQAEFNSYFKD
jgi:tetratricopeptide (TPR) repeat protein